MHPTLQDIIESIPNRFRPEKASDINAIFHFILFGNEPLEFTATISNGKCLLSRGLKGIASCVVKAKSEHYLALELGELNPQMAMLTGKVKVSALSEMMTFAKCFYPYKKFISKEKPAEKVLKSRKPDKGPLVGYRVLDLTRLLPGPWAMAMLADMGAEVIKVEDPDAPDYVRGYPPFKDGKSVNYMAWNRSKRSAAINIRDKEGKNRLLELVQSADVLIEQFRPGAMAAWGLGYDDLRAINPKLIYVSITGYGQTGPMANAAGHDLNYMALSGLLSQNKDANGRPIIPGVQWADIASGSYQAIQAVLAALLYRTSSGEGQYIDISMTDGLLPIATISFNQMWATGITPQNSTESLSGLLPNYNVYETSDGKWMALGALEPKFWERFCEIVGKNQWREKCIPGHPQLEQTKQEVAALFKQQPQSYWLGLGEKEEICLTPVLELNEVEQHPHFKARQSFDYSQSLPQINTPIKFGSSPSQIHWSAPELGEDAV